MQLNNQGCSHTHKENYPPNLKGHFIVLEKKFCDNTNSEIFSRSWEPIWEIIWWLVIVGQFWPQHILKFHFWSIPFTFNRDTPFDTLIVCIWRTKLRPHDFLEFITALFECSLFIYSIQSCFLVRIEQIIIYCTHSIYLCLYEFCMMTVTIWSCSNYKCWFNTAKQRNPSIICTLLPCTGWRQLLHILDERQVNILPQGWHI